MSITKQRIEDRPVNYIEVHIHVESGCNPKEGEYILHLASFNGSLDLSSHGGVDDISLIKECVEEIISDIDFKKEEIEEGLLHLVLKESGEWEDVFWHKYYVLERKCWIDYQ